MKMSKFKKTIAYLSFEGPQLYDLEQVGQSPKDSCASISPWYSHVDYVNDFLLQSDMKRNEIESSSPASS